jgi:hypothetical protein
VDRTIRVLVPAGDFKPLVMKGDRLIEAAQEKSGNSTSSSLFKYGIPSLAW